MIVMLLKSLALAVLLDRALGAATTRWIEHTRKQPVKHMTSRHKHR
jgi:hypothetical protein